MMGCKYGESEGCGSFFCRKVGGGKLEGKNEEKATWAEIEAAVDEQMNQVRVQLLQDLVQMGESEDWRKIEAEVRPQCATCGESLSARGEQTRYIQTTGGQAVKLTRTYGTCPACGHPSEQGDIAARNAPHRAGRSRAR